MELSQFTDYSLRTLIYAALREPGQVSSVREIAEAFAISHHHLVKVVHNLARLGYVETVRGRKGGVLLAKKPESIRIGDVVRQTESLAVVECHRDPGNTCCIAGVCHLQSVLAAATRAFMAELDKVTLEDLVVNQAPLRHRLKL